MDNQAPKVSPRHLALRFISGKYQGGEFPLAENQEIFVGRSSDLDMVLVEDMVSRRHARIACTSEQISIEDLASTNGTFVNGEKIRKTFLKEGDRVLIGTSILKVVSTDPSAPPVRRRMDEPSMRTGQTKTMSGSIDEIPLPDLLQLFGTSKKSGILVIRSDEDVGKIYLRKGIVTYATINDLADMPPLKSVYRILTWMGGTFDLEPAEDRVITGEISATVQELLMEGLRQIDELNNIRHLLPDLASHLVVPHPLKALLRELGPIELDVFQVAYNHRLMAAVLNKCPATDLETAQAVLKLIQGGYLRVE
jgi:pSer/pThr/pTyr-binding forkhead associated (FHA) protein